MKSSNFIEKIYNIADTIHSKRLHSFYKKKGIDCLIDVGSHKGEFIVKVIRDTKLPIFSFEPQLNVTNALKKNTNSFNIKEHFTFALSDFTGESDLHLNSLTSTSSLIKSDETSLWIRFKKMILGDNLYEGTQKTKIYKMDEVLANQLKDYKCVLMKIDVEGGEASVLKGAAGIIKYNQIAYIQIENANFNIYEKVEIKSPFDYLKDYNYVKSKKFTFPFLNFTDVVFEKVCTKSRNSLNGFQSL